MNNPQPQSLLSYNPTQHAELLAGYCLYAAPQERIMVAGTVTTIPLVQAFARAVLQRGARPLLRLEYSGWDSDFIHFASGEVLDELHPADLAEIEAIDGSLRILAPELGAGSDAQRRARFTASRALIAAARARKKWALTLYPTVVAAAGAGQTLPEFEDFVMRAMFLDRPDPIAAWGEIRARQAELILHLEKAREVRIEAAGTDITLKVGGRIWANSDGKRNMPSGEVFTGPIEDSAEGVITFTVPATYNGQWVRGARLVFKAGKVIEASAEEGQDVLLAALATDAGAKQLGELGIGTNTGIQRPTGNILFDEKISGTVHLALGKSYPETGGLNQSAIHWDLITDLRQDGRLSIDGQVIQENGAFKI